MRRVVDLGRTTQIGGVTISTRERKLPRGSAGKNASPPPPAPLHRAAENAY
jgi:hypothetical protein